MKMKRFLTLLLCLTLLCGMRTAAAAADNAAAAFSARAAAIADSVIAYGLHTCGASTPQEWLDGKLAQTAGSGAEWYVLALAQSGAWDLNAYADALSAYVATTTVRSAATRQKLALMLMAANRRDDPFIILTAMDTIGRQGVMSWIWGLHLVSNGCSTSHAEAEIVAQLLSMQLEDGGWAVSGKVGDADVTAMALQALAPCRDRDPRLPAAIDRALAFLSDRQRADGGFASYGVANPESAAQVLIALCALGVDGLTDARFIKNGCTLLDGIAPYQLADGSFSHTLGGAPNANATAQVLLAMTAYQRLLNGQPGLFLLDDAEPAVRTSPGYKPVAALVIAIIAMLGALALFLAGKRHRGNFLALFIAAACAIAFVFMTDFESADSYYSGTLPPKGDPIGTATLAIRCDKAAAQSDAAHIPANGVMLAETAFPIAGGDTVFTLLTEAARTHALHMESSGTDGMRYVSGIGYLYEFDLGDLSGWVFLVNGVQPSVGCDQYVLADGDHVEWVYTLEMGRDLP